MTVSSVTTPGSMIQQLREATRIVQQVAPPLPKPQVQVMHNVVDSSVNLPPTSSTLGTKVNRFA